MQTASTRGSTLPSLSHRAMQASLPDTGTCWYALLLMSLLCCICVECVCESSFLRDIQVWCYSLMIVPSTLCCLRTSQFPNAVPTQTTTLALQGPCPTCRGHHLPLELCVGCGSHIQGCIRSSSPVPEATTTDSDLLCHTFFFAEFCLQR